MAIFACAAWRPIGANMGGSMSAQYGLLLHHQAGDGSLFGFFSNPAAEVSAHFWVSKAGAIEQYVDSERVAWHAKQMNDTYCGVETEGCGNGDEPLTSAQIAGLGAIFAEGMARHGWAATLANADGERGLGYHRMGVQTACPCDLRLAARPAILDAATGGSTVGPPPSSEGEEHMGLASAAGRSGRVLVEIDAGGNMWGKVQESGSAHWSNAHLGGDLDPGRLPTACIGEDGQIDAFATRRAGGVFHQWWQEGRGWHPSGENMA